MGELNHTSTTVTAWQQSRFRCHHDEPPWENAVGNIYSVVGNAVRQDYIDRYISRCVYSLGL